MSAAQQSQLGGPLLASSRSRLAVAAAATLLLWIAVLWASLSEPLGKAARAPAPAVAHTLNLVVASGQPAPTGGKFDRFDVGSQPIVAPVNNSGQIAFYASVARAKVAGSNFVSTAPRDGKTTGNRRAVAGGGML